VESIFSTIFASLGIVIQPHNVLILTLGVVVGLVIGVLPGFGAAQALALMLPFTFGMDHTTAVLFFIAIYSAAEYGGSVPAILIRTPGTTASAITLLDGFPLSQQGKAKRALHISLWAGICGGIVSSLIFLVAASSLAWLALQFGPGEMFAVGVFGLAIVTSFFARSPLKGMIGCGIGLLLATVGSSGFGGLRFTFNQPSLLDGIPLIVVIIGFLAMPEVFALMAEKKPTGSSRPIVLGPTGEGLGLSGLRKLMPSMLRGSLIGTLIGAIPGPGATVASLVAYNEERRWTKDQSKFGKGAEEGVAAPEAANNAVVAGSLVPTLALGIPGSGAIAILLGMLVSKGVVPGPLLFSSGDPLVMAVFVGLIACNIVLLLFGLASVKVLTLIARIPRHILAPFVMLMLMVGTYSYQNYSAHLVMVLVLGAFAAWIEKLGISVIPIVLTFVMGPIIEQNLVRGLAIHGGNALFLFTSPITLTFLTLAVITMIFGFLRSRRDALATEPQSKELAT
jgi:putative tricarboxylic transport membrane protein